MSDFWYMAHTAAGPRHPHFDSHEATALAPDGTPLGLQTYYVQARGRGREAV